MNKVFSSLGKGRATPRLPLLLALLEDSETEVFRDGTRIQSMDIFALAISPQLNSPPSILSFGGEPSSS